MLMVDLPSQRTPVAVKAMEPLDTSFEYTLCSDANAVDDSSLPFPDRITLNIRSDPEKKSHARKQPPGHIPRPRNAFILFRCDFVRQKKVPIEVEGHHRNISRIAGSVWQHMTPEQKRPWKDMAAEEKRNHERRHPGYKYRPGGYCDAPRGREKQALSPRERKHTRGATDVGFFEAIKQARKPLEHSTVLPSLRDASTFIQQMPLLNTYSPGDVPLPLRRSSSCPPPGAFPILPSLNNSLNHTKTVRDDLSRRPSRVTFYQSAPPSQFDADPEGSLRADSPVYFPFPFLPTSLQHQNLHAPAPIAIAPPADAPGWYEAPPPPAHWTQWTDNVGKQLKRQELARNHDFDNTLVNTVPNWFAATPDEGPSFTNPFGSMSISPRNAASVPVSQHHDEHISPFDTSFMSFNNFLGPYSIGAFDPHLESYTSSLHASTVSQFEPTHTHTRIEGQNVVDVPRVYPAFYNPGREQSHRNGPSGLGSGDVANELRLLVPRLSLYERDDNMPPVRADTEDAFCSTNIGIE